MDPLQIKKNMRPELGAAKANGPSLYEQALFRKTKIVEF